MFVYSIHIFSDLFIFCPALVGKQTNIEIDRLTGGFIPQPLVSLSVQCAFYANISACTNIILDLGPIITIPIYSIPKVTPS